MHLDIHAQKLHREGFDGAASIGAPVKLRQDLRLKLISFRAILIPPGNQISTAGCTIGSTQIQGRGA